MNKDFIKNGIEFFNARWPGMISGKLGDETAGFWDGFTSEHTATERNFDDLTDTVYEHKNEI